MVLRRKVSSAASICLNAERNDVFKFLIDPKNTKRWNKAVEYVSHRPQGPIRVGTVASCRVGFLGTSIGLVYRIVDLDEPNSFLGEGSSSTFNYTSRFDLDSSSDGGRTDVTWSVAIEYSAILPIAASYVTREISSGINRNLAILRGLFV
jgi:carbon monoxide dehydrogenase subunit G